jgi:hypothetical protein
MKHLLKALQSPIKVWVGHNTIRLQSWLERFLPTTHHFPPLAFEFAQGDNVHTMIENKKDESCNSSSIFDLSILMAAPKSKVKMDENTTLQLYWFTADMVLIDFSLSQTTKAHAFYP